MAMKRTCEGCRALNDKSCDLGYKTEWLTPPKEFSGLFIGMKPVEECPKPKTYDKYLELYFKRER
jgi:hypothetical protein